LDELARDPRRVYSVECIFFLKRYWDERPERQAAIRDLVNQGRLRLTSSGVTTADTLLPSEEALLRDFLIGQEWLRANGMTQEPRLAYFPDSFG
jgi:alpha-mannosidase